MWNPWSYVICILGVIPSYVFCTYQNCRNISQNYSLLLLRDMYSSTSTVFGLLMNKERQKCKGTMGRSIFYFSIFCVIIFSLSSWLIQGSNVHKKKYDRVPLLQCLYLLSTIQASSCSNKMWSLRAISTLAYSFCKLNRFTFYFYARFIE